MDLIKSMFPEFENVVLTEADFQMALPLLKGLEVKKGDRLLEIGQICEHFYFIQNGVAMNSIIENGQKKVVHVFFAGEFLTALYSFYSKTPAEVIIEALTDMNLLSIHYQDVHSLYDRSKNWERIGRIYAEQSLIKVIRQKVDLQHKDARQRYQELVEKRPELLQLLSLGQIASILGISQETLSRIRAKRK